MLTVTTDSKWRLCEQYRLQNCVLWCKYRIVLLYTDLMVDKQQLNKAEWQNAVGFQLQIFINVAVIIQAQLVLLTQKQLFFLRPVKSSKNSRARLWTRVAIETMYWRVLGECPKQKSLQCRVSEIHRLHTAQTRGLLLKLSGTGTPLFRATWWKSPISRHMKVLDSDPPRPTLQTCCPTCFS